MLEMGYGRQELAAAVCAEGLRPLLPRSCPPGFSALMNACWAKEPTLRPSFSQVRGWCADGLIVDAVGRVCNPRRPAGLEARSSHSQSARSALRHASWAHCRFWRH